MFEKLLSFFAAERQRSSHAPLTTQLVGEKVICRVPDVRDWKEWTQLRYLSEAFLQPWEPEWPKDATGRTFYMRHWQRLVRRWVQDREYCFLVVDRENGALLGGITLTDIQRNARQSATLGYWMGLPYTGRGHASEAARLVVDFGFKVLELSRIEATCMPDNEPSLRLLRRIGMRKVGLAQNYMQIGGKWRDHYVFEMLRPAQGAEKNTVTA
jgi:ribosomal-protein-alanine N-acetyltransferase